MRMDERDLDITLLRDGPVALYFKREKFEAAVGWFDAHGYAVKRLECATWDSEEAMHAALARALDFPDYYGGNWNALNDCLGDLEEPLTSGLLVAFDRFDAFAQRLPVPAHTLLDLLAQHSRRELVFGGKLIALAQSDDPQLALSPVGAVPVLWNRDEWADSQRRRPTS